MKKACFLNTEGCVPCSQTTFFLEMLVFRSRSEPPDEKIVRFFVLALFLHVNSAFYALERKTTNFSLFSRPTGDGPRPRAARPHPPLPGPPRAAQARCRPLWGSRAHTKSDDIHIKPLFYHVYRVFRRLRCAQTSLQYVCMRFIRTDCIQYPYNAHTPPIHPICTIYAL